MIEEKLQPFLPEEAILQVAKWMVDHKIHLTITQKRDSVLGDYRSPRRNKGHRISINGNLNRYTFLITFVHEMAHLTTFEKYHHTVSSHGKEWKQEFRVLMNEFKGKKIFPQDVTAALKKYLIDPSATHCADPLLMKVLNRYNEHPGLYVQDLMPGELFMWREKKIFKKGEKLRTRFKCYEVPGNRLYLFSPVAEVKKVGAS